MKVTSNQARPTLVGNKKTLPTLTRKHQLYELIVDSRGRPDTLAINLYWDEFRSWYNDKKQYKGGKVINFPKLHSKGIHVCYKFLASRYGVVEETIRRKIVKLEKLGLLGRDFEQNINYGKVLFNQMVIHIWQQTDHFYNPIGVDRAKIGELKPSTNHKYISSKYNTPDIHKKEDRGYPQNVDIYNTDVCIGIHSGDDTKTLSPVLKEISPNYVRGDISVSSIITTETNTPARDPIQKNEQNKHATFAPCSLTQQEQVALTNQEEKSIELERKARSEEATGMFAMSDLMAKVLKEPQKSEEILEMNLEELPMLTDKQERAILLSRALWQAFGEERSGEIQDDYKFVEQDQQKVCIQTKEMRLNDIEKAKIRKAIQSVYGEDVTIAMQVLAPASKEPMPSNENTGLPTSKSNLLTFKAAIPDTRLINLLTNPLVKAVETSRGISIEAAPFFIDQLTEAGNLGILEDAVVKTRITLELIYKGTNNDYANSTKKPIVLTPEKILKDREWLENHRKSLQEGNNE